MARKKAAAADPLENSAPSTNADAVDSPEVLLNKDAEPLEDFLERMKKMASFDGKLVWVDCDLPGYGGVRVAYNVDNRFAVAELFKRRPPDLSMQDTFRMWSLFIRKMEWPWDIPAPTPDDPSTYEVLLDQFQSLVVWLLADGYTQAKTAKWGN